MTLLERSFIKILFSPHLDGRKEIVVYLTCPKKREDIIKKDEFNVLSLAGGILVQS